MRKGGGAAHFRGVLRASIVHLEVALQAGHHELVHVNVRSVELHTADAVLHVGLHPDKFPALGTAAPAVFRSEHGLRAALGCGRRGRA